MAASGRLFRRIEGSWQAIGEPLPEFTHAPITPGAHLATWVLPADLGAQPQDVIVAGEQLHRLLAPVPRDDAAWMTVAQQAAALSEPHEVAAWLAAVELWLGQLLPEGRWPD